MIAAYSYTQGSIVRLSVARSVGLLVNHMIPAKTIKTIDMSFGTMTRVGPKHHVLDGSADPPREAEIFWGEDWRPILRYRP